METLGKLYKSLCFGFLICQTRIIVVPTSRGFGVDLKCLAQRKHSVKSTIGGPFGTWLSDFIGSSHASIGLEVPVTGGELAEPGKLHGRLP